jgi:hypothetical protein
MILTTTSLVLTALVAAGPLAAPGHAQTVTYPPTLSPDAGPIGPAPDAGADTATTPPLVPAPQPPEPVAEPPAPPAPGPAPVTTPPLVPAPAPSAVAPAVDSCLGLGEADGEVFEILVRLDPSADDPVLIRLPGFPPADVALAELVVVEAGALFLAFVGECTAQGGGGAQRLDQDSVLELRAGSTVTLAGAGVIPGGEVSMYLFSEPTLLGSSVAAADGVFEIRGVVDEATPLGPHVLQVTAVGDDGRAYRIAFGVAVVGPQDFGAGDLLDLGWMRLLAALILLVAIGALVRRSLRERHCILVGLHADTALPIVPGVATAEPPPLPVASRGRRPTMASLQPAAAGLTTRDRSLVATGLRLVGDQVHDLDDVPVPVASTVVVGSDEVTLVLAVRRADGGFGPLDPRDAQLRAEPDGTLVLAVGGSTPRARITVTLRGMQGERVVDERRLARLRADDDGRAYARVPLPTALETRVPVIQVCIEGRRRRGGTLNGA